MDIIAYNKGATAQAVAESKVQKYSSTEANRPNVDDINEGDEWFNQDTGRTMMKYNGVLIEQSASQPAILGKADTIQDVDTTTKYIDKTSGLAYKIYVDNGNIVLEEL